LTEFEHSCGVVQITWAGDQLVQLSEFGFDLLYGKHPLLLVVEDAATSRTWSAGIDAAVGALTASLAIQIATSATAALPHIERHLISKLHRLERTVLMQWLASVACAL
jgi:hypothetical protein